MATPIADPLSADQSISHGKVPRRRTLVYFQWAVTATAVTILIVGIVNSWAILSNSWRLMIPWLLLVAAAEFMPLLYRPDVSLTLSVPLLLAAGMTLGPVPAGVLGFLGTWDARVFKGKIGWDRALFNRSQVALSSMAAAATFAALGGTLDDWTSVLAPCAAALVADQVVNVALVSTGIRLAGGSVSEAVRFVAQDSPWVFLATFAGLAPLAVLIAVAAERYGTVGLLAGVVPILMARQVFALLKRTSVANQQAKQQQAVIRQLNNRIESERRDERARLAMDLHDGALSELYRVHLMGEVLRQDLMYGRLLELESDVPDLREATLAATESLRGLIRDLRYSSVGAQGVSKTLDLLIDELQGRTRALFHTEIDPVNPSPSVQLLVYQVAREALENSVRHSDAQNIHVRVRQEDEYIRLVVRDDGAGFAPASVDSSSHFGLTIMAQRVEAAGGLLHIASEPGWGTQVVARLPSDEG